MATTRVAQIDAVIQRGRGVAASVLGQTYDVRRLDALTNVSLSSNIPIFTGFPARIERITTKAKIENQTFDMLVYKATCDARNLLTGDTFAQTGYENDGGNFTLAQRRPTRETLWVRTEFNVTISRMQGSAGMAYQQPRSGVVSTPGYAGTTKSGEEVLTLYNGLYAFTSVPGSIPAQLQVGLQPLQRVRDGSRPHLPTALYREHFVAYIPDIPGEMLNELDRLNLGNSDRYEVMLVYTSDVTGFGGNLCLVEKLSV